MDRQIKVLPGKIANLIAAGEVVQRPASVVKELMENSVDAGAKNISVIISDSGKTLIQVIDDGCGMTPENARISFERHATSKIATADDLGRISTYGFRGEALASIAAVAEVTLKTRTSEEETGMELQLSDSRLVSEKEISCPAGCNFEIRSIFYNIPARRKFLKSDRAEMQHIIEEFCRVALTRTETGFRISHNGKNIYSLPARQLLKQRIVSIAGNDLNKQLIDIRTNTSIVKVSGFVGIPSAARKQAQNQYFFVNGRYFRSPYLHRAVCRAYEHLVQDGYTPPYFIYLDVDTGKVDVNIHPSKTEIKFEDDSMIFEILNAAVREALGKNAFVPSIDFSLGNVPEIPLMRNSDQGKYRREPKINYDPLFNPFLSGTGFEDGNKTGAGKAEVLADGGGELFENKDMERRILVFKGKYIFTPVSSGLLAINASRARYRVMFEHYLDSLGNAGPAMQKMLVPVTLELTPETEMEVSAHIGRFAELGFEARMIANNALEVDAVPDGFATDEKSVRDYIDDILASLEETVPGGSNSSSSGLADKLARAAAYGKSDFNDTEAQLLVEQLLECRQPQMTPDGKNCMTIISTDKLDSMI
ncbi:MAG: DNA mismatch repair endonuclease MutL [Bacteroidales bacterium]|nr:DNA mismatch repair endonuclease MutL [Bacteroidales bacterium]